MVEATLAAIAAGIRRTTRPLIGLALVLAASGAGAQAAPTAASSPAGMPVRVTLEGGIAEGVVAAGVGVFRGLPYAAAPVADLRWRAPAPAQPWDGVRPATRFGPACPQDRSMSIDQAGDPGPTAEDCLYLNVWSAPGEPTARRPVLVWIHGGAFAIGAGSQRLYDGAALARRGAVVVTFNYRLGALGFFSHPALAREQADAPVNFGLLDQIAALRWVKANIAAFGGDAGNVTIFGESAGAQSVLALFVSPLARGLFERGIAQSAYGIPSHPRAKAQAAGIGLASAAGLGGADATLEQLRAISADRLTALAKGPLSLSPSLVVGDAALPEPIVKAFQRGREAKLPLIVGSNSDEASVAVALRVDPGALIRKLGAARVAIQPLYPGQRDETALGREVVTDVVFAAYARRIAYLHAPRAPTWRYHYSRVADGQRADLPSGVPHGGEIAAVFDLGDGCACLGAPLTEGDRTASRRIADYWVAFARAGVPAAADAPAWPPDGRRRAETLEFGADGIVPHTDFQRRRLDTFIGALNVIGLFSGR